MQSNSKRSVIYFLTSILVFLMIFTPTVYGSIKLIILVLLMGLLILEKGLVIRVNKKIMWWFAIYIFSNIFGAILSSLYGNKLSFNTFSINILQPFVYFVLCSNIDEDYFNHINHTVLYAVIAVELYNIIFTLGINNFFSLPKGFVIGDIGPNYGGYSTRLIKYEGATINWLMFAVPMYLSYIIFYGDSNPKTKHHCAMVIATVLGVMNAILSLRTAFIIVLVIVPLIGLLIKGINIEAIRRIMIYLFGLIIVGFIIYRIAPFFLYGVYNKIAISFSDKIYINEYGMVDSGYRIRIAQIKDLIDTWKERPILGWGIGANANNIIRSNVEGSYEVTYVAMLMQKGIVGTLLYWIQIIWIYIQNVKIIRKGISISRDAFMILVGFSGMIIASFTNPYFGSFDRQLMFFYPLLPVSLALNGKLEAQCSDIT